MKKTLAMLMAFAILFTLCACGQRTPSTAPAEEIPAQPIEEEPVVTGTVIYFNDDPALEQAWKNLAARYSEQTGVPVKVISPAAGTYGQELSGALGGAEAPTLFVLSGAQQLQMHRNDCYDLSGSEARAALFSDSFTLKEGDAVLGLAYRLETFGLITNQTLLDRAGYTVDNINCFADLKKVAEVITARRQKLGFSAFTSAGLDATSETRFNTQLVNLPLYFEQRDESGAAALTGSYLDNFKAVWDLYLNNSTCKPTELLSKTADDSRNEFLAGNAVFYQSSAADYENLKDGFAEGELTMLPIYFGVGDEEYQGLCSGSEHYWCVNANAPAEDLQATLDFLDWLATSAEALTVMANDMRLELPFQGAPESVNPFERANRTMIEAGIIPVTLCYEAIPSEEWKIGLSEALAAYAEGRGGWEGVVSAYTGVPVAESTETAEDAQSAAN